MVIENVLIVIGLIFERGKLRKSVGEGCGLIVVLGNGLTNIWEGGGICAKS